MDLSLHFQKSNMCKSMKYVLLKLFQIVPHDVFYRVKLIDSTV